MYTEQGPLKPLSKRTQRACDCCKIAKVRCNVREGCPCSYCVSKGVKCTVDNRRRRRFRRRRLSSISEPRPETPYSKSSPGSIASNIQLLEITSQFQDSREEPGIYTAGTNTDQDSLLSEWTEVSSSYPETPSLNTLLSYSVQEDLWEMFTSLGTPVSFTSGGPDFAPPLPGFIRPLPTTIGLDSIEHLHTHGALILPSLPLQNALMQRFAECVLPCTPILEWPGFANIINARDGSRGQISLLLFHAVMFSATTFVELEHLLEAGYSNREEAHESFFEKAKLLYYSDYESDALTIVQALLLLTNRSDTADIANSKHWSEIAISVAQPIGLFHEQASSENPLYCPKLWRRVGWACYMADCLIALRLRRRPSIKRESFGHRMLTMDDFDSTDIAHDQLLDPEHTLIPNVESQEKLFLLTISQARLCVCISEVLEIQGKDDQLHWSIATHVPDVTSSIGQDYIAKVSTADKALGDWMDSLPPQCQYPLADIGGLNGPEPSAVVVQRSSLHMIHHTVTCVLHQSQTFPSSQARVHHAARQITEIASELHNRSLHNCLSRIGVTAILVAMIIHIAKVKSAPPLERQEAMHAFQSCLAVMASLQDIHSETKAVTDCMLQTMEKAAMEGGSRSRQDDHSAFCDLEVSTSPFIAIPSDISDLPLVEGVELNGERKDDQIAEDWDMYTTI